MTRTQPEGTGRRVAVIGSGLAGLTTAYLLRQKGVTVYLIEKSDKIGFHSSSIDIDVTGDVDDGESVEEKDRSRKKGWTIDVPMRSFQGGYYPNLIALYRHLEIPLKATYYTFSFARLPISSSTSTPTLNSPSASNTNSNSKPRVTTDRPHFIHSGASGHSIPSLPSSAYTSPLAFITSILKLVGYAGCYILLLALSFLSFHNLLPTLFSGTLRDFTNQISNFLHHPIPLPLLYTPLGSLWKGFIVDIVIPLFSSVGTMPEDEVYATPVGVLLEYIHKTVGTDHYSPARGHSARTIAERLAAPVKHQGQGFLRLGAEIKGLKRVGEEVVIELRRGGGDGEEVRVDRVVLATPASVAGRLLGLLGDSLDGPEMERVEVMRGALKGVRYKETIVVTHRDHSILPNGPDVRDINLIHPTSSSTTHGRSDTSRSKVDVRNTKTNTGTGTPHFDPSEGYTMATHVIRSPPSGFGSGSGSRGREQVYQSTNPCLSISSQTVLGIARLERALPLPTPHLTLPALNPGKGSVYIVGSYANPGIPLLEGCVGSSRRVVDMLVDDLELELDSGEGPEGGEVDWNVGRGGLIGRSWRWRRVREL